mmetsp:Transcript_12476/g.26887  ORF Transcript_12476/g.26887 Transcript_12476/m.26887 type:complete len:220 (+) Transcript_12476:442-1101(+)
MRAWSGRRVSSRRAPAMYRRIRRRSRLGRRENNITHRRRPASPRRERAEADDGGRRIPTIIILPNRIPTTRRNWKVARLRERRIPEMGEEGKRRARMAGTRRTEVNSKRNVRAESKGELGICRCVSRRRSCDRSVTMPWGMSTTTRSMLSRTSMPVAWGAVPMMPRRRKSRGSHGIRRWAASREATVAATAKIKTTKTEIRRDCRRHPDGRGDRRSWII